MDVDESSSSQAAYSSLIQTFNRFLLECMGAEADVKPHNQRILHQREGVDEAPSHASALSQLVGLLVRTATTCKACGYQISRDSTTNVLDFVYPAKVHLALVRGCTSG
jgi:PAB-dependent poly(A)-specific ribonuclease subunit 2